VSEKRTLLLVDDTPANLDLLREILSADYQLRIATSGEIALKLALREPMPALILLDVSMPGLDGYEVCRRLKSDLHTARIPVIFVSALDEVEDEAKGFEAGGVDYITKPISAAIVQARVRTHLELADQEQHLTRLVFQRTKELREARRKVVARLARAVHFRHQDSGAHVIRLSAFAKQLALLMGSSEDHASLLEAASAMHDIGKVAIPDAILLKPGPLTEAEWVEMKKHPDLGASIIGRHGDPMLETARAVALNHHEKWDGSGYPNGMAGEKIPLAARIVAVCDVFDAFISPQPYRPARNVGDAAAYIRGQAGKHFDPAIAKRFVESLPQFVELSQNHLDLIRRESMLRERE
jgi:putative two-component system response regulator